MLKDGIGQLGGILFASRYGGHFDEDIKKWRFFAMSSLNASILIEIMTLKFPHLFLLLASIANMGKNSKVIGCVFAPWYDECKRLKEEKVPHQTQEEYIKEVNKDFDNLDKEIEKSKSE